MAVGGSQVPGQPGLCSKTLLLKKLKKKSAICLLKSKNLGYILLIPEHILNLIPLLVFSVISLGQAIIVFYLYY
jgi:hypothetical protein